MRAVKTANDLPILCN